MINTYKLEKNTLIYDDIDKKIFQIFGFMAQLITPLAYAQNCLEDVQPELRHRILNVLYFNCSQI